MNEGPTVSSPLLQQEKPRRLAADAADDRMMVMADNFLETFATKLDALKMRMDAYAKQHGYA